MFWPPGVQAQLSTWWLRREVVLEAGIGNGDLLAAEELNLDTR
jgi:hypothetical protein